MTRPEPHTVVRFKLRSLLAITFGVALVMAVLGPSIRDLDPDKKVHLVRTVVAMSFGAIASIAYWIRKRLQYGSICGKLLLALPRGIERHKTWYRWVFILIVTPYAVAHLMNYGNMYVPPMLSWMGLLTLIVAIGWSNLLVRYGLPAWVEGYPSALEFCENGVLIENSYYPYSSKRLKDLSLLDLGQTCRIRFGWHLVETPVPPHQREGVEAILEHYYRPHRRGDAKNA